MILPASPEQMKSRQSSAAATQNACRTAGDSTAATQNVCRTAGHLPLVHLGIHPGHYRRMSGGNSYVFEISGGNSHTIQQVPSRKRLQIRHSFSNERKPPVIQIGKTEERMEIRQSFGANGKMNARGSAIRSQTKENRQSSRNTQTPGGQLPIGLEKHTAQHWPSQSARTPASRSPSGRVPDASPQRGIAANGGPQP